MTFLVLMLGLVAWLIALPLCGGLIRWSRALGLVDAGGGEGHKPTGRIVPDTGGVAVYLAVAGPMTVALLGVWLLPASAWASMAPWATQHLEGLRGVTAVGGGLLVMLSAVHLMGLYDDRRPLGPWRKLGVQAAIAVGVVVLCETRVLRLMDDWGAWGVGLSVAVSVAWVLVIVNAMNFLDNMDGLCCGVAAVAGSVYLAATLIAGQWFVAGLCALLVGALLAVLVFNAPPAKVYLGDGGSLLVGLILAVVSMRTTYTVTPGAEVAGGGVIASLTGGVGESAAVGAGGVGGVAGVETGWHVLLMPLMVLAVPLYDFVSVVVLRLLRGQSPMVGDHNHFSHRLVRRGLSRPAAVAVICLATLATGLSGAMLTTLAPWQAWLAAGQTLAVLAVLAVLERGGT
ncbi:MAG: MraY family glycosyltransferase [Planctomycetota bacterium]